MPPKATAIHDAAGGGVVSLISCDRVAGRERVVYNVPNYVHDPRKRVIFVQSPCFGVGG